MGALDPAGAIAAARAPAEHRDLVRGRLDDAARHNIARKVVDGHSPCFGRPI